MAQPLAIAAIVLAKMAVLASAGGCSDSDQTFIHNHKGSDGSSFGATAAACGHSAYSIFSGFNVKTFSTCLTGKTHISETCSACFAQSGKYGADNCKMPCLSSWCSSGCLSCTAKAKATLESCTGFKEDDVKPCSSEVAVAAAGCSGSDQTFIHNHKGNGGSSFGATAAACGRSAYSIVHGFNVKTFSTCLTGKTHISETCSTCFAQSGKYGADNCKMSCLSSWCSAGCLSCTAKAKATLESCTGFKEDDVKPCSSEVAVAAAGCSGSDQTFIHNHKGNDGSSFGATAAVCGHSAYSIFSGFNVKTFSTCLTGKTHISETCSTCFAQSGKYGADNCKMACLSSWCSSGCLSCTGKNQQALESCTGFKQDVVPACGGGMMVDSSLKIVV